MQKVQFNKVLISLMNEKGKSIKQLAEVLGCTTQAISNYRLGKSMPNYESLIKLADYFDVSCDYLLTGVKLEDKQEHKELGLSGAAIYYLKQCSQDKLDLIDRIISNDLFDGSIDGAVKLIIECGYNKDNVIDKMLFYYSYICYLKKMKLITKKEFMFLQYEIERTLNNRQIKDYFYNLYHFANAHGVKISFEYLFEYGEQIGIFDFDFYDKSSINYPHYLNF